ncbi:lipocalin family protein [Shewanella yunxiaonensis]|uniref:Outer membrane lipoprotein Blc n=1 Tax=Shewanella yunxiaonensis TaxID=2829809 RepID=A0ABX7YYD7_9GAMM|nr:lipocalin family protein [Shewanella yunxiaonensis]QUN07279.1 lipocalin family protein [Shewanella yunxiaonensis]
MFRTLKHLSIPIIVLALSACTIIDKEIPVVTDFKADAYVGTWYEIARLDHSFERGLTHVTATYNLKGDALQVINRGFNPVSRTWKEAEGIAYFMKGRNTGLLKVSFFRPFYGAYQVHALLPHNPVNGNYQNSIVMGPNDSYLWLLSRTRQVTPEIKADFIHQVQQLGIDPNKLIWVTQTPQPELKN